MPLVLTVEVQTSSLEDENDDSHAFEKASELLDNIDLEKVEEFIAESFEDVQSATIEYDFDFSMEDEE